MFEANAKKHFEAAIKKKRQFDDLHLNADDDDDEGWTDQEDEDDSCSDITTASSRGSTPTPRSSPKRSPLLSKKVRKLHFILLLQRPFVLLIRCSGFTLNPTNKSFFFNRKACFLHSELLIKLMTQGLPAMSGNSYRSYGLHFLFVSKIILSYKQDKKLKKRSNNKSKSDPPKVDDDVVTEAIVVYSQATVVWQDGTIESGISSRHLYPIHHLDEHVNIETNSNSNFRGTKV